VDGGGWHSMMEPFRTNIVPNIDRSDAPCLYNVSQQINIANSTAGDGHHFLGKQS
jgi:hypothetical protein